MLVNPPHSSELLGYYRMSLRDTNVGQDKFIHAGLCAAEQGQETGAGAIGGLSAAESRY